MTTTRRGSAGTLLGGRYRLLEPLPGAGRSWRARDEIDDRPLLARSIELPAGLPDAERQQARQRALREAAVVARVQHPGVAPVVDAVVEDGAPWVISALPPGRSLGEIVADEGPVTPVAAALIGLQVLDALAAAGVPHGELTPYDVVIAENGRVQVIGFATTPLGAVGTRGFGAPEGGPGPAADLWALGVTLHVAVEGRMPGGPRPRAGALGPALNALLARGPEDRSDPEAIRPLLVKAAGEPADPPPPAAPVEAIHDPEVAAALAAFDAALASRPVAAAHANGATPVRTPQTVANEPTAPDPAPQAVAAAPAPPAADPAIQPDPAPQAVAAAPAEPATPTDASDGGRATRPDPALKAVADAPAVPAMPAEAPSARPAIQPDPAPKAVAVAPGEPAAEPNAGPDAGGATRLDPALKAVVEAAAEPATATPHAAPAAVAATEKDPDRPTGTVVDTDAALDPAPDAATPAGPALRTEAVDGAPPNRPTDAAAPASPTGAVDRAGDDAGPDQAPDAATAAVPASPTDTAVAAPASRTGAVDGADVPRTEKGATAAGPRRPPANRPATPEPDAEPKTPAGRRRLIGAGIVAAVLAAVLIPVLLSRGDDQPTAAPPAATTAAPQPTGTTASPDTPIPPPAGWQLYRDPAGWSIAVPDGWTATHRGTAVTFTKADRTLRVTARDNPPKDTFVAAENLQPVIEAATPGFDFLRLANVSYRAWPTTDLEFRAGTTTRTHSLIRSTVPNPRQVFDFTWTCLDRTWTEDRPTFDTALQTFDPGA